MGRSFFSVLVLPLAFASGCYKSHELGGPHAMEHCAVPGESQSSPCGRCGTQQRICTSDGYWTPTSACTSETTTCGLDVMLLADVTGSHTGVFQASAGSLSRELIVPLEGDADVRVGVSAFADYPVGGYGSDPDAPFIGVLEPTHDVARVNAAIMSIMFLGGVDQPESEIEGLNDLVGGDPHPTARPFMCTSGFGGGCWRIGATWHVIVVMTDTASHGLPGREGGPLVEPYGGDLSPPAPEWDDVRRLLVESGTYVYWIVPTTSGGMGTDYVSPSEQAREIARQIGEDPEEAVNTYPEMDTTPAIVRVREHIVTHFGLHTSGP